MSIWNLPTNVVGYEMSMSLFLTDIICEHITIDEVVNRRNQLEKEEAEVFVGDFPEITKRAKKRADKQLKKDSRYKSTIEERKSILPSHLNLDIE